MVKTEITTIRISKKVHKKAKIRATELGITIKKHIENLIKEDIQDKKTIKDLEELLNVDTRNDD